MAAEGAERAQVRERTPRASNMRDLRTLSCLAVPVHGHWAGGGEGNPPVRSPSFKNVEFLSDISFILFPSVCWISGTGSHRMS